MNIKDSYVHLGPGGNNERALVKHISFSGDKMTITRARIIMKNGVEAEESEEISIPTLSTAASANTIKTVASTTNASFYLTFVDSNNASATSESLYTAAGVYFNPSSSTLNIGGDLHVGSMIHGAAELTSLLVTGAATFNNTITGSITGNAGTANKLYTARKINGTDFDGSSNITTTNWGTARTLTIKDADNTNAGTGTSINGSTNYTLNLPSTIKATLSGNASTATTATNANNVAITAKNDNVTYYPTFVSATSGNTPICVDNTATGTLTYNPSTGTLSYQVASIAGNATVGGSLTVNGNTTIGDAAADTLTVNSGKVTFNNTWNSTTPANAGIFINRIANASESAHLYTTDDGLYIDITQDEYTSKFVLDFSATDTENSDGSRAFSNKLARFTATKDGVTLTVGKTVGNLQGNASTASNLTDGSSLTRFGFLYQSGASATSATNPGASKTATHYLGATTDANGNVTPVWTEAKNIAAGGYWANVQVSNTSSTTTVPTFASAYLGSASTTTAAGTGSLIIYNRSAANTTGTSTTIQSSDATSNYTLTLAKATGWIAVGAAAGVGSTSQAMYMTSSGVLTAISTANLQAGKDGNGDVISSTYLKLSGGTMTGSLITPSIQVTGDAVFDSTITGNISGNAGTATALLTTRTLWGLNFNGTANVSGNISGAGNISGTGILTMGSAATSSAAGIGSITLFNREAAGSSGKKKTIILTTTSVTTADITLTLPNASGTILTSADVSGGGETWESSITVNGTTLKIPAKPTYSASDVGLGNVTNEAQIAKSIFTGVGLLITSSAASTPVALDGNTTKTVKYLKSVATTDGTATQPTWALILYSEINGTPTITNYKWASLSVLSNANFDTSPEFSKITLNGRTSNSTTAATTYCRLEYDSTNKCLKFVFA